MCRQTGVFLELVDGVSKDYSRSQFELQSKKPQQLDCRRQSVRCQWMESMAVTCPVEGLAQHTGYCMPKEVERVRYGYCDYDK